MPYDYDLPFKPIQVLAVACSTLNDATSRSAWLHGYAVLTIQPTRDDVEVRGTVMICDRYVDDARLLTSLESALDPEAVLAGMDLTNVIAQLGRLPIGTSDQRPALALLDKIETMLGGDAPLDVAIDIGSRVAVALNVAEHKLLACRGCTGSGEANERQSFGSSGSLNPAYLAAELADTVSAAALTIGEMYLEPQQGEKLVAAWQRWREAFCAGLEVGPEATGHGMIH
jgi:hypothetical protein